MIEVTGRVHRKSLQIAETDVEVAPGVRMKVPVPWTQLEFTTDAVEHGTFMLQFLVPPEGIEQDDAVTITIAKAAVRRQ